MAGVSMEEISKEVTKMPMEHKLNIYQRMLKAQSMINTVSKNLSVGTGNNTYKAVSERDVLDAVKEAEKECGIYSYPYEREIYEQKETTSKYGSVNFWIRLRVVYRFVNVDDANDYIDVTTYGDGVDTLDKAPGKGMTYADKYALMKAYKISTGDDQDKSASEEQENSKKQNIDINQLLLEFKECQRKLSDLGVDIYSESIKQWMANHTGYGDQQADIEDYDKMLKLVKAYNTLINAKEQANG